MIFSLIFFLIFISWPDNAFAWGPATHLQLGWQILSSPSLIAAPVKILLDTYPYDYLYGCISADIVVGKKFTKALNHCHNWRIGFKVMEQSNSPSQEAFAYGYLSHLAADTIAHNYFVPEKMVTSYSTRLLRHVYWEMRFDALADRVVWDLPYGIMKDVHKDNDPLLENVLENNLLSFRTNKTIFNNVMILNRMENWHKMISRLSSYSRWVLNKEDADEYYQRSLSAVIDIISNGERALCLREDPAGRKNLALAKRLRTRLKFMKMAGITVELPALPFIRGSEYPVQKIRKDRA
ncbi:MAG: zinc dependent phospholipase C family protein [Nitrospira sp.]|nr:zinc dependent phospholipase C family protein [Nitrospira sp.]